MRRNTLGAALATALALAAFGTDARATIVISVQEVGPDVVATASGSIDTTGLAYLFSAGNGGGVFPTSAAIIVGPFGGIDIYSGLAGPSSFGSGGGSIASPNSGDLIAINGLNGIVSLPTGYVSNAHLEGSSTFMGSSFAGLGLNPGTYVYTLPNDTLTVQIGAAAVPEPSSVVMLGLAGLTGLGITVRRRRKVAV